MKCNVEFQEAVRHRFPESIFKPSVYDRTAMMNIAVQLDQVAPLKGKDSPYFVNGNGYAAFMYRGKEIEIKPNANFIDKLNFIDPIVYESNLKTLTDLNIDTDTEQGKLIHDSLKSTSQRLKVLPKGASSMELDTINLSLETIETLNNSGEEGAYQAILHELVHANTVATFAAAKIDKDSPTKLTKEAVQTTKELNALYAAYATKSKKFFDEYANKTVVYNKEEFLAHAIANPKFQAYLNEQTLWQKVKAVLRRLLGLSTPTFVDKVFTEYKNIKAEDTRYRHLLPNSVYFGFSAAEESYYTSNVDHDKAPLFISMINDSKDIITQYEEDSINIEEIGIEKSEYLVKGIPTPRLSTLTHRIRGTETYTPRETAEFIANNKWSLVKDAETKLPEGKDNALVTKEEFIEFKTKDLRKYQLFGTLGHLHGEKHLSKAYNVPTTDELDAMIESNASVYKQLEPNEAKHNFSWLTNIVDEYLSALQLKPKAEDPLFGEKAAFEVGVYSPIMNVATRVDMIAQRNLDGRFILVDHKFGSSVLKKYFSRSMAKKYSTEGVDIIPSNAEGIAKLELMLRAIMIKENHPDAQFAKLVIGNLQNGWNAALKESHDVVDIDVYLPFIKNLSKDKKFTDELGLTNPKDKETLYTKLIKKSPKIFDTSEYYKHLHDYSYDSHKDTTPEQLLHSKMQELRSKLADADYMQKDKAKRELAESVEQILKTTALPKEQWDKSYRDLGWLNKLIGNHREYQHPMAREWARRYLSARNRMTKQIDQQESKLNLLASKLVAEHKKRYKNIRGIGRFKIIPYSRDDKKGLYDFAYKTVVKDGVEVEQLVQGPETQVDPNTKKETLIKGDKEWYTLTSTQQAFLKQVNSMIREASTYYNTDRYSVNIKKGKHTISQQMSTLDLFNHDNKVSTGFAKRTMDRGFFFKTPMNANERRKYVGTTLEDELEVKADNKVLSMFRSTILRNFTRFEDREYFGENMQQQAIPIKGLGNGKIDAKKQYTKNLLESTLTGYRSFARKKHLDDIAVQGYALTNYFAYKQYEQGKNYMDYSFAIKGVVERQIVGRTMLMSQGGKPFLFRYKDSYGNQREVPISWDKVLSSLGRFATLSIMPFRIFQTAGTTAQAYLTLHRDITVNGLYKKLFTKLNAENNAYSLANFKRAHGMYLSVQKDAVRGKMRQNKLFRLASSMQFLPNSYMGFVKRSEQSEANLKGLNQDTAMLIQNVGEDIVSYLTLAYQMLNIKHKAKDPKTGKLVEKSIYDWYEVNEDNELVWTGGVRKHVKDSLGNIQEVRGLTDNEINSFRAQYEMLQGSYREEELAPIEAYTLGKLFMALSRWLPAAYYKIWGERRKELLLGAYEQTGDMVKLENGETVPVWEWKERESEGVLRTVVHAINGIFNTRYRHFWRKGEGELKEFEKRNMLEFTIGFTMFAASMLLYTFGVDDDDKETTQAKWARRYMIENMSQLYNPINILDNAVKMSEILAFTRTYEAAQSMSAFMWALVTYDRTQKGDIRHAKELLKTIPYISPIANTYRMIEEWDTEEKNK